MAKYLVAVALATVLWMPQAKAQSILQRNDWQRTKLEAYLSSPVNSPPWPNLAPGPSRQRATFRSAGTLGQLSQCSSGQGVLSGRRLRTGFRIWGSCSHA